MARIMIVDDALFMRTVIRTIVEQAGHRVVAEARDGEEACEKYALYKPDLITMDITMHGMSGLEAVKSIIAQDKAAKIIMVSAMAQKSMVIQALKYGAKHFIIKPITVEQVIKVVNEVLGIKADIYIDRADFKEIKKTIADMKKTISDINQYIDSTDNEEK